MTKLLPITLISLMMAWLSQHTTFGSLLPNGKYRKNWLFFLILTLLMVLFSGLRTDYNDTQAYIYTYLNTDLNAPISLLLGNNPGYTAFRHLLKSLGASSQTYLMVYSAFIVTVFLWFVHKYSCNFSLSVFLLFTTGCYLFSFAAVKQCVAIAFCLLAIDRFLRKHYAPAIVFLILGVLFHPYALMFMLVPFLCFRPWTRSTWFMLIVFFVVGLALQPLLGPVVDITTMIGEEFSESTLSGKGVNPLRLAVMTVPILLSLITHKVIWNEEDRTQNLILNLTMLNATIMFVGLFGSANYFLVFQSVSLPWLLSHFETKSRRIITFLCLIGYSVYFVYANAISSVFDHEYFAVSFFGYLRSLF